MMKIEDAIKRYESWAEDDRIDVLIRKEHRQMADWLKELKADRPQGEWLKFGLGRGTRILFALTVKEELRCRCHKVIQTTTSVLTAERR